MYTDPSGEWFFLAIGIAILSHMMFNAIQGIPPWYGVGKAVVVAAVMGGISFGIGSAANSAFSALTTTGKALFQAGLHGIANGLMSEIQGGTFISGFAAGVVSSLVSSAISASGETGELTTNAAGKSIAASNNFGNSPYFKAVMIASGGLSGGISSSICGGSFATGFMQGVIVAGMNHLAHSISQEVLKKRMQIAANAKKQNHSTAWSKSAVKDDFNEGTNKCNKFVHDVITSSGVNLPTPNGFLGGNPLTAEQWADPDYTIQNWKVVNTPQAGDVVAVRAQFGDATGHVAIMLSEKESIGASTYEVHINKFGSDKSYLDHYPGNEGYIYRRYYPESSPNYVNNNVFINRMFVF